MQQEIQQLWSLTINEDEDVEMTAEDDLMKICSADSVSTCDSESAQDERTNGGFMQDRFTRVQQVLTLKR